MIKIQNPEIKEIRIINLISGSDNFRVLGFGH